MILLRGGGWCQCDDDGGTDEGEGGRQWYVDVYQRCCGLHHFELGNKDWDAHVSHVVVFVGRQMWERDGCGLDARDHRCQTGHDQGEDENVAMKKRKEDDGRGWTIVQGEGNGTMAVGWYWQDGNIVASSRRVDGARLRKVVRDCGGGGSPLNIDDDFESSHWCCWSEGGGGEGYLTIKEKGQAFRQKDLTLIVANL